LSSVLVFRKYICERRIKVTDWYQILCAGREVFC
jgi:hypothetical protein